MQARLFPDPRRLHPKWGYDMDKVPEVHCSRCHQPIGHEPYVHDTMFARFGDMFFFHARCATKDYLGAAGYNRAMKEGVEQWRPR
jgi:hypothetical protein